DGLRQRTPPPRVSTRDDTLDANHAEKVIPLHDVVADCTDDAHVKQLLDRVCADYGVALVSGSVHGRQAQVILLHADGENEGLSRQDLFQGAIGAEQDGCDMREVPLATLEETGRRMAQLLRALLHKEPVVNGRIDLFDGQAWTANDPPAH